MGVAIGSFAVTALLLRPYAGREADRRGRRALLVGGALLSGLAIAAHAIAPNLTPALWDDPEYATDDWAEGMGELTFAATQAQDGWPVAMAICPECGETRWVRASSPLAERRAAST